VLSCDAVTAESALQILRSSRGMMVRQPLARAGHSLADCDYHAISAPYKSVVVLPDRQWGKGAAGKPATKLAFMLALEAYAAREREREEHEAARRPLLEARDAALAAFAEDFTYMVAIAQAASAVLRRRPT
jgi:hypothetical protein